MVDLLEPPAVTDPTEPAALRNAFVHSGQASGSSDGLHAGTAGRDLRMSSAKYQCVHCGVGFHRNDVYINLDEPSMDGKGLNLICRECFREQAPHGYKQLNEEDHWQTKCKIQWLKRAFQNDEHSAMGVRSLACDAGIEYPGQSRKEDRERLIRKSTRLAVSISAGLNHLTADQQLEVIKVMDLWVDEWSNEEEDPEYIPAMDRKEPISDLIMEFVDQVLPGLDRHFICRQKHCSMVCRRFYWAYNPPNDQYRCPACGEQNHPWKAQPGYWTTNKVFVTYDEVGLQQEWDLLKPGEMAGHPRKNQVMILPVMWPDTSRGELIDRVTAIFSSIDRDLMALPPKDRLGFVLENLSLTAPPKAFETQEFFQGTREYIDHVNAEQNPRTNPWKYDHIEHGYIGMKLGPEHELDDPWQQVEFVRLWGLSMWLTQMAAASLSLARGKGHRLVKVSAATSSCEAAEGTRLQ